MIHELAQLVRTEEGIDHARNRAGVHQILRCELLSVAGVHPLTDGAGHTGQTQRELLTQLLTHSTNTAVAQVIDIIDLRLEVLQTDKLFDDRHDVVHRENRRLERFIQMQTLVQAVAAHFTEIIFLIGEEQALEHLAGRFHIRHLSGTDLAIHFTQSSLFVERRVFAKRVQNHGTIRIFV